MSMTRALMGPLTVVEFVEMQCDEQLTAQCRQLRDTFREHGIEVAVVNLAEAVDMVMGSAPPVPASPVPAPSPLPVCNVSAPACSVSSSAAAQPPSFSGVVKSEVMEKLVVSMPTVSLSLGAGHMPSMLRKASIDTGAGLSCISEAAFQRDRTQLLQHGTYVSLTQPITITMYGGQQVLATHMVRDARLFIGKGWYSVDLLVVPGAVQEILLAGDFLCDYDAYVHYAGRRFFVGLPREQRMPGAHVYGGYQSVPAVFQPSWMRVGVTPSAGVPASA